MKLFNTKSSLLPLSWVATIKKETKGKILQNNYFFKPKQQSLLTTKTIFLYFVSHRGFEGLHVTPKTQHQLTTA